VTKAGMVTPSHNQKPRKATRRSGGVVTTTYAAMMPTAPSATFATVRAVLRFMIFSCDEIRSRTRMDEQRRSVQTRSHQSN
jgi:hypothetical protein